MKLLFSLEAVSSMLVECYRGNNNETGGILIGPKEHKGVVTDIIPSSSFAERRPATYYQSSKDVKILNKKLKGYQLKGYDFKGYFHRHPSGLFQLSQGDLNTCSEILRSANYRINNFLIMCIVTESRVQDFPVFSYSVSFDKNKRIINKQAEIKVLAKTCILECAECFEPSITGMNHENYNFEQNSRRVEGQKESRTLRSSGKKDSNSKLT